MEDVKVGELVRTKKGKIFEYSKGIAYLGKDNYITKHSFNLIDLLENNDIVLIKTKGTQFVNLGIVRKREDQRSGKLNILVNGQNINEFEILEVLTHEQYEANCYKVKGE